MWAWRCDNDREWDGEDWGEDGLDFLRLPASKKADTTFKEPSDEEKRTIINQAIKDCINLLETKLGLLKKNDSKTLLEFKKWFGSDDEEIKQIILKRIRKALTVCKKLTIDNFNQIVDEKDRRENCAIVHNKDKLYRFFLGDSFWLLKTTGRRSKAGVLIHELSHFKKIGNTHDNAYNDDACLELVRTDPKAALYNADSFEFFIEC